MMKKIGFSLASVALLVAAAVPAASAKSADAVSIFMDAPLIQGSYVSGTNGTTSEDFNSFGVGACPTTWGVGTISGVCNIASVRDYGGATGAVGSTTPTVQGAGSNFATTANASDTFTLTLAQASRYVGFYWTAGSPGNTVTFYDGATEIMQLTTNTIVELLGTGPANAGAWTTLSNDASAVVNNGAESTYKKAYYFGNPRGYTAVPPTAISSQSAREPFVYLHLFASGSVAFDSIKFSGGGFEFDNLVVSTLAKTPTPELVPAGFVNANHTVNFDSNGGEGTMAGVTGNVEGALPLNTLTNANAECTFAGWNTESDGSGTAFADGATFSYETNETLFAQWDCPEEEVPVEEVIDQELADTGLSNSSPLLATLVFLTLGLALLSFSRRSRRS